MIVSREFLEKLKIFGLNSYEVKIWTALLARGISTAGELSDIANVPRSRAYDILESLEKKGFVVQKLGKPIKYIAIPPEEVVERVKKRIKKEAEEKANMVEHIKKTELFNELKALHTQGIQFINPMDVAVSLKGRQAIYEKIAELLKEAQRTVLISTNHTGLKRKADRLLRYFRKAANQGVKIEILVPKQDYNNLGDEIELLRKTAKIGASQVNARFVVVDNKHVVIMTTNGNVNEMADHAIWVQSEFLAKNMVDLIKKTR